MVEPADPPEQIGHVVLFCDVDRDRVQRHWFLQCLAGPLQLVLSPSDDDDFCTGVEAALCERQTHSRTTANDKNLRIRVFRSIFVMSSVPIGEPLRPRMRRLA
jgi:hypothetical protein